MRARSWLAILGGVAAGLTVGAGMGIYSRRSRLRKPHFAGAETPGVAAARGRLASWPAMRAMRGLLAGRAARLADAYGRAPGGPRPAPWVELGCGTGQLALALAQKVPGVHVVGIDRPAQVLAQARDAAAAVGLVGAVTFESSDARALPFPDDSVDMLVSACSLHHWADPAAALNEIARVLRPGAVFLICDLRRDMGPLPWLALWLAGRAIVPRELRGIGEPLGSRNAAYTAGEAARLAQGSALCGWRVTAGIAWLTIEGQHWP
jgi:SAM-dependent methyltransferase